MKAPAFRIACTAVLMLALAACQSMRVNSNQYPGTAFDAFSTWAWISADPMIVADGATAVSPLISRQIREAIETEMAAKGYRRVETAGDASFVLAFTVGSRDRIDAQSYPMPYRGPWLWEWRGSGTDIRVYQEGTLSIDIFDGKSRQPVWHGWATKAISDADRANPGPAIQKATQKILKRFPSRAG